MEQEGKIRTQDSRFVEEERTFFFRGKCQKKHLDSQDADKMIWHVIHIYCFVLDNGCTQLCVLSDWTLNRNLKFLYRLLFGFNLSNRFFDMTPLGLILNRFSADTNIIDQVDVAIHSIILTLQIFM